MFQLKKTHTQLSLSLQVVSLLLAFLCLFSICCQLVWNQSRALCGCKYSIQLLWLHISLTVSVDFTALIRCPSSSSDFFLLPTTNNMRFYYLLDISNFLFFYPSNPFKLVLSSACTVCASIRLSLPPYPSFLPLSI